MIMTADLHDNQTSIRSMHKTKAELFVYGYVRNRGVEFKLYCPTEISHVILQFFPTKYTVIAIGEQYCGQFGVNHTRPLLHHTKLVQFSQLINHPFDIKIGWYRSIIINASDASHSVYSAGNNNYNQCGLQYHNLMDDDVKVFAAMHGISQQNLHCISEGTFANHVLFVYKDHRIIAFGCNNTYQLGIAPNAHNKVSTHPIVINNMLNQLKIAKIACGGYHTLILTDDQMVWSMGKNDRGQCGLAVAEYGGVIKEVTLIPDVTDIVDVQCGAMHNLLLDSQRRLIAFGDNRHGEVCMDMSLPMVDKPVFHEYFQENSNIKLARIVCGAINSLVIDCEYQCYIWGSNTFGQVGNGSDSMDNVIVPFRVQSVPQMAHYAIIDASIGDYHTVLLTQCNKVYVFGKNGERQCSGQCAESRMKTPYQVKNNELGIKEHDRVQRVIAGGEYSIFVCEE